MIGARIRMANAAAHILGLLGLSPTVESLQSAMNPFIGELPSPVDVVATGSPPTYQIVCAEPHIRIATGDEGAPAVILVPSPAECPRGMLFSFDLYKGDGGSDYALLGDGVRDPMIIVPRRYQMVIANGNTISFLNDWYLWGDAITNLLVNVGSPSDEFGVDESLRAYVGAPDAEADPDGPLWAAVRDLQDRVAALEPGE